MSLDDFRWNARQINEFERRRQQQDIPRMRLADALAWLLVVSFVGIVLYTADWFMRH